MIPRDYDDSFDDNSDGISDDDGDIYIMMKCLCVTRRLLGLAGQRPALASNDDDDVDCAKRAIPPPSIIRSLRLGVPVCSLPGSGNHLNSSLQNLNMMLIMMLIRS